MLQGLGTIADAHDLDYAWGVPETDPGSLPISERLSPFESGGIILCKIDHPQSELSGVNAYFFLEPGWAKYADEAVHTFAVLGGPKQTGANADQVGQFEELLKDHNPLVQIYAAKRLCDLKHGSTVLANLPSTDALVSGAEFYLSLVTLRILSLGKSM